MNDSSINQEPRKPSDTISQHRRPDPTLLMQPTSTFLDKVIAFVLLIVPFGAIVSLIDGILVKSLPGARSTLMLVAVIAFLLLVGRISRKIYKYRKTKNTPAH